MTEKLPVRTIALHTRKKTGTCLGILSTLMLTIGFSYLLAHLDQMPGKVITSILFLASAGALFFYLASLYVMKREKFVGFFISGDGLNDISTGHSYGVVYWKDVVKIRPAEDPEHPEFKYIVLKVKDPQQYIDRESFLAKKRSLLLKYHRYGSPVCFSNRGLNCTFEELLSCVEQYYENYKKREKEGTTEDPSRKTGY
jgi:hypothetical protein